MRFPRIIRSVPTWLEIHPGERAASLTGQLLAFSRRQICSRRW